jgi:AraC family transcriptional regulator of adaptative response / DNA-3-methyladenine glycosylase II
LFPSASRIACTSPRAIAALGILPARATTMVALAKLADRVELTDDGWLAELRAIDGIGVWTAEYVAMRALGWPDALPTGDRALCRTTGLSPRELEARAESWRPWRSYAVMQLWSASASERKRS